MQCISKSLYSNAVHQNPELYIQMQHNSGSLQLCSALTDLYSCVIHQLFFLLIFIFKCSTLGDLYIHVVYQQSFYSDMKHIQCEYRYSALAVLYAMLRSINSLQYSNLTDFYNLNVVHQQFVFSYSALYSYVAHQQFFIVIAYQLFYSYVLLQSFMAQ